MKNLKLCYIKNKELELINIMRKYQKVISVFIGSSLLLDVAIGNKMN